MIARNDIYLLFNLTILQLWTLFLILFIDAHFFETNKANKKVFVQSVY